MPFEFTATQLTHFAAALGAALLLVVVVVSQLWPTLSRKVALNRILWPPSLGLLSWEVIAATENLVDSQLHPVICAGVIMGGVLLAGMISQWTGSGRFRRWADWLLGAVAGTVGALALLGATTDTIPVFDEDNYAPPALLLGPANVQPSHHQGYTDRGRAITLYEVAGQPPLPARRLSNPGALWPEQAFASQLIRTAPPRPNSNCHGWVFTAGQFVLSPDAVKLILQDNGYYEVQRPAVGDLIVYYDQSGMITHTGIVRATGADGMVLIESKWGCAGGTYLHFPELWFSARFVYYRTVRGSHQILGLEHNSPVSVPVQVR